MKPEIPELTGREGRLEHVRRLRNWSIHDLAEIAGVGRNTAWHWVTGRVRRVGNHEALQAIAHAANVDVSWLITGKGSPARRLTKNAFYAIMTPMNRYPLRQARLERGASLADVAAFVGITESNLSRIERQIQMPSKANALKIYKFFGGQVPMTDIFGVPGDTEAAA